MPTWLRLDGRPRLLGAPRAAELRADAVAPVIAGDEVAAGVAHDGHIQLPHQLHDVLAEALFVRRGVAGLIDAAVDGAAEVLDEGAVDSLVHLAHAEVAVECHFRLKHDATSCIMLVNVMVVYALYNTEMDRELARGEFI